jgi:hypothetical protein
MLPRSSHSLIAHIPGALIVLDSSYSVQPGSNSEFSIIPWRSHFVYNAPSIWTLLVEH